LAFISGSKGVKLILLHKLDSFKRQWEMLEHPPYSLHLAPTTSNYLDL